MRVDRGTLKDLEVFAGRNGQPSLFHAVNRTRTRAGARALRERLESPWQDPTLLEMAFRSSRYLAERRLGFTVDPGRVIEVERYLTSNLAGLGESGLLGGRLEAAWISMRHPELLTLAREGVASTRALVEATRALCSELDADGPPPELAAITGNLLGLLDKLQLERFWARQGAHRVLAADEALRVRHRGDLLRLLELLGRLDASCSAAELVKEGYAVPEVVTGPEGPLIAGKDLRHPHLEDPGPNPVHLDSDRNVIFLTGPNMAGKTTWLRSVGVSCYLAHCGLPVPAGRFRFTPMDALFVVLSPEDNIHEGVSYFQAEILRVRNVLESVAGGRRTLALFDEAFRGTNVHDATELTQAVVTGCAAARGSAFLFSSHLAELAESLESVPSVANFHFAGEVNEGRASFDYRLRAGPSRQRLGLHLFRESGLDDLLRQIQRPRDRSRSHG